VGFGVVAPAANAAQSVEVNCRQRTNEDVRAKIAGKVVGLYCNLTSTYVGTNSFTSVTDYRGKFTVWYGYTQAGGVFSAGQWADISNRVGQKAIIVLMP
jgi:hypothetical protein